MGEVGDHRSLHPEVDLDGRSAQFGMRRRAGIGPIQPSEPGDIAGQFDDPLVVDVIQHRMGLSGLQRDHPWRAPCWALYMGGTDGKTARLLARRPIIETKPAAVVLT